MAERHTIETPELTPQPATEQQQAQPAPVPSPAAPARNRRMVRLVVLAVLAAAGFGIWRAFFATPPLPESIVPVSGRIEGDDSAVSPKTTGRILEIRVREGDSVNAGDIIAILDDEQLRAREQAAQAALSQSEAKAKSARDQIAVLDQQLRQEEANVTQQEAAADIAQFDKEAYTRLAKTGAVSERQGRQAASAADQQAAAVVVAKRRVAGVHMQLSQQQADIASALASLSSMKPAPTAGI
jgi:HlyD family secretion protein